MEIGFRDPKSLTSSLLQGETLGFALHARRHSCFQRTASNLKPTRRGCCIESLLCLE